MGHSRGTGEAVGVSGGSCSGEGWGLMTVARDLELSYPEPAMLGEIFNKCYQPDRDWIIQCLLISLPVKVLTCQFWVGSIL